MKRFLKPLPLACLCALPFQGVWADTAVSDPIGFNKIQIKNNSDTNVSVPFHKKPVFTGALGGALTAPADDAGTANVDESTWRTLTPSISPGWTPDSLNDVHFVRFTSGARSGFHFPVVDNAAGTVSIDPRGADLSAVAQGDTFTVLPYMTLNELFPAGGGLPATTTIGTFPSLVLIPNNDKLDINKGVKDNVYFYHQGAWRDLAEPENWFSPTENSNGALFEPLTYVIVRLEDPSLPPAPNDTVELCVSGRVPVSEFAIQIDVGTGPGNDNHISFDRPVPITLDETGLLADFQETTDFGNLGDVLLIFDESRPATNKGADNVIVRFGGQWFDISTFAPVPATFRLQPGHGVIYRKAGAAAPATNFVTNSPSY